MEEMNKQDLQRPEKEEMQDPITEERLHEILSILLPYGYSHYGKNYYTGVSPYIGYSQNVITIIANQPTWGVLAICMEKFSEDEDETNSLGFYKGIMKVIAPELHSTDEKFMGNYNVLDFYWADDRVQDNAFPVEVKYKPF